MSEKDLENVTPENEEALEEIKEENTKTSEDVLEETEDTVQEGLEEAEDTVEETLEEIEEVSAPEDETQEVLEETAQENAIVNEKKKVISPAIIAIVVVALIVLGLLYLIFGGNKYNKLGYANPSGKTIEDVAQSLGVTLEEFLEQFGLPEDMPKNTTESAAFYSMPLKSMAAMYGTDAQTMIDTFGLPEETTKTEPKTFMDKVKNIFNPQKIVKIDENTPWGLVEDELTLGAYYGEENVQQFVEYYGLEGDITAQTKYKEVRKAVEKKTMEMVEEQNKAMEEEKKQEEKAETEETSTKEDGETEQEQPEGETKE